MHHELLGHHVTLRLSEDRVLTPSRAARLAVTRWLLAEGRDRGLVTFSIVDTHLHLVLLGSRRDAGRLAHALEIVIHARARPGVPFAAAHFKPIRTVWHLSSCFGYVLDQHEAHGVAADPWREGTPLPDLLGLRVSGRWAIPRVREHVPRLAPAELRARLPFERDAPWRPELLPLAAAAAVGLPELDGSRLALRARRAAVLVGRERWPTRHVRDLLGLSRRTASRHAHTGATPELLQAVRHQLAFLSGRDADERVQT